MLQRNLPLWLLKKFQSKPNDTKKNYINSFFSFQNDYLLPYNIFKLKQICYHTSASPSDSVKVTGAPLGVTYKLLEMVKSICYCYECLLIHIQKIDIIAQFSLDILLIQTVGITFSIPKCTWPYPYEWMNGLNQKDAFIYVKLHAKNRLHTSAIFVI